jgi:hypothetical protein
MRTLRTFFLALALFAAVRAVASTNVFHAQWFFVDQLNQPLTNRTVSFMPLWTITDNGTNLVPGSQRFSRSTGSGASITLSNLQAGGYRVEYNGPYSVVTFTNVFPTNAFGLINAGDAQYLSASLPIGASTVGYSQAVADGRFVHTNEPAALGLTNTANQLAGAFNGSGTISNAQIAATVAAGVSNTFVKAAGDTVTGGLTNNSSAGFRGNGAALTNLAEANVVNLTADLSAKFGKTNDTAQSPTLNNPTNTGVTTFSGPLAGAFAPVTNGQGGVTLSAQFALTNAGTVNSFSVTNGNVVWTGIATGTYSNHVWHFYETIGTTNIPIVGNFTNKFLNTAGKHVTVAAGSPFITSTDGAFAGLRRGYQFEMLDNNQQLMLFYVTDANNATAYEVGAGTVTFPTVSNAAKTNWVVRPPAMRWTDDTIGAENYGGYWDDNGMMHFAGIGDQGIVFFENFDNASVSYVGIARENSVGINSGGSDGHIVTISSQTTNSTLVGSLTPFASFFVHNKTPSESGGFLPSGVLALGPGAQYAVGGIAEGITNRHGFQTTMWVPVALANWSTLPAITLPSNGGALLVSNKVLYFVTTTKTNQVSDGR